MANDLNKLVAKNFTRIRLNHGHKQEDTAKVFGLDRTTYSRMETGNIEITMGDLDVFSDYYQVTIFELFRKSPDTVLTSLGKTRVLNR